MGSEIDEISERSFPNYFAHRPGGEALHQCRTQLAQAMQAAGECTRLKPREMLVLQPATADTPAAPIDNELRFADEPARHKLLDLIGDLALAGAPIRGRVIAHRSGHATTHAFVRALLAR